jgi:hypothetical protein
MDGGIKGIGRAKVALEPRIMAAYDVIINVLRIRQTEADNDENHMLIGQAIEALDPVRNAGWL